METYDTFNAIVKSLFRDVMDLEGRAILTGEFQNITNNDMHVMEAIGMEKPKNMSSVAKELSVTVGTLTIAVNSLVKKDMSSGIGVNGIGGWSISLLRN